MTDKYMQHYFEDNLTNVFNNEKERKLKKSEEKKNNNKKEQTKPKSQGKKRGRQAKPLKYIVDPEARLVCASKRKAGFLKKADELAIYCGAHVAALVVTETGEAYCYTSPRLRNMFKDKLIVDRIHEMVWNNNEDVSDATIPEAVKKPKRCL